MEELNETHRFTIKSTTLNESCHLWSIRFNSFFLGFLFERSSSSIVFRRLIQISWFVQITSIIITNIIKNIFFLINIFSNFLLNKLVIWIQEIRERNNIQFREFNGILRNIWRGIFLFLTKRRNSGRFLYFLTLVWRNIVFNFLEKIILKGINFVNFKVFEVWLIILFDIF